ncbi:TatD family hydrolase [Hahella aquimaris]|uniref:TatD family hydrolase n=1 Tax=Hahella sp. HNIBRBA332 TaxID=3015983 RepID=UPI00273BC087|nr:TatD family hydrolase [Hahella sp. HNIBRBA332]WLQ17280.1 TatD family hydrolase [Hahella sp. HNIBRBA332]
MFDIGVNLTNGRYKGKLQQLLDDSRDHGVGGMIAIGTSVKESLASAKIAEEHPGYVFATAGVHPHDAKTLNQEGLKTLKSLLQQPHVVAVGEMGLDFNRNFSTPEDQEWAFAAQLELNRDFQKPLYLHERDAYTRQMEILRAHRNCFEHGVTHCFTGTREALFGYLDLGLHIGVTGWICDERRAGDLVNLVKEIPRDRLLVETDSPFLMPRSIKPRPRNNTNFPWFVREVIRIVALYRGETEEDVRGYTAENARRLFQTG